MWELSSKLQSLSLSIYEDDVGEDLSHQVPEQSEAAAEAIEALVPAPLIERNARDEHHLSIACRTIVAAARGGQLRRIAHDGGIQKPYAIRTLLPFWVQVESWNGGDQLHEWFAAAKSLRLLLAHTSRRLEPEDESSRLLTGQDVQALLASFKVDKAWEEVLG